MIIKLSYYQIVFPAYGLAGGLLFVAAVATFFSLFLKRGAKVVIF